MAVTPLSVADYLKYSELQMAAEAFLVNPDGAVLGNLKAALKLGNGHASRFTDTEATEFLKHWEVVAQRANSPSGFSGTLFRCIQDDPATGAKKNELVMSMRSTEFIDDAARDNQATNTLEIKDHGFAFGQIADMEEWYASLVLEGKITDPNQLSVTGYSLGGHLATVFNLLRSEAGTQLKQVVTFNGAGVGTWDTPTLTEVMQEFDRLRFVPGGVAAAQHVGIADTGLAAVYERARQALDAGQSVSADDMTQLWAWGYPSNADGQPLPDPQLTDQARTILAAIANVESIRGEVNRLLLVRGADGTQPKPVALSEIEHDSLDYQMAMLITAKHTDAASVTGNGLRAFLGKTYGGDTLANQFDVVGATSPSAVANSYHHWGIDVQIFIEDQPLVRGGFVIGAALESLKYASVKLLVDEYGVKDFGDTHSLVLLVDSLMVQNAVLQLLPSGQRPGAQDAINRILKESSYLKAANGSAVFGTDQGKAEGDVLENVVNALGDLVLGPRKASVPLLKGNPDGNTWAEVNDKTAAYAEREELHQRLQKIVSDDAYKRLSGKLNLAVADESLAERAPTDFFAYAALYSLSPFAYEAADGQDAKSLAALLSTAWGDTYNVWAHDYEILTNGGNADDLEISGPWLADRAEFLRRKKWFNTENINPENPGYQVQAGDSGNLSDAVYFDDVTSGYKIAQGQLHDNVRRYYFADDQGRTFSGGAVEDHLYGGGGSDSLRGLAGADWLEGWSGDDTLDGGSGNDNLRGGMGADTYVFSEAFGLDIVKDSDGQGRLVAGAEGTQLTGGGRVAQDVWESEDKQYRYTKVDGNLVVTLNPASGSTLNGSIIVQGWQDGQLGLSLGADVQVAEPTSRFVGDYKKMTDAAGTRYILEADGNYSRDGDKPGEADLITGSASADRIQGLGGNDALLGREGDDRIEGGEGVDVLMGGRGRDTINGGAGDDLIYGSSNGVLFYPLNTDYEPPASPSPENRGTGFTWNWSIDGKDADGFNRGVLTFNVNRDRQSDDDTNLIDGGAGNDVVYAGTGHDVVHGGDDSDDIWGMGGHDVLLGEAGRDRIYGDSSPDMETVVYSTPDEHGNDLLVGGAGDDILIGQGGSDVLFGGENNDLLYGDGRSSADTPDWLYGDDYLEGGAGVDQLFGGGGNDVLIGGTGGDYLEGGAGQDIYYYNKGDGLDTISDTRADNNIIRFGAGVSAKDIEIRLGSLMLDMGGGDAIHIENFNRNDVFNSVSIGEFQFADGTTLTSQALLARGFDLVGTGQDDVISGTNTTDRISGLAGNDTLQGGLGSDVYIFNRGDGADTIDEQGDGSSVDVLKFGADILRSDVVFRRTDAGELEISLPGTSDRITVKGWYTSAAAVNRLERIAFADGVVLTPADFEHLPIAGSAGDDVIVGTGSADQILGGRGNDELQGGGGADVYLFNRGDGADTIEERGESTSFDVLRFGAGILPSDVSFRRTPAGELEITLTGTADSVTIKNWYTDAASTSRVEQIAFDDGTVLTPGDFHYLSITGTAGDDSMTGTSGYDILDGGAGQDTYYMAYGMGVDRVIDNSAEGGVVQLANGLAVTDLWSERQGADLLLQLNSINRLLISGYFNNAQPSWVVRDGQGNTTPIADLAVAPEPGPDQDERAQVQREQQAYRDQLEASTRLQYAMLNIDGYPAYETSADGTISSQSKVQLHGWVETGSVSQQYIDYIGQSAIYDTPYTAPYQLWGIREYSYGPVIGQFATIKKSEIYTDDAVVHATGDMSYEVRVDGPMPAAFKVNWGAPYDQSASSTSSSYEFVGYITATGVTSDESVPEAERLGARWLYFKRTYSDFSVDGQVVGQPMFNYTIPDTEGLPGYVEVQYKRVTTTHKIETINLGPSNHTVYAAMHAIVNSGDGSDVIYDAGYAYGGGGNDTLIGGLTLMGGDGDDLLRSGKLLNGGSGDDTLIGGEVMVASQGRDQIYTGVGAGTIQIDPSVVSQGLVGGAGDSTYFLDQYYRSIGIDDWEERRAYPGLYALRHSDIGYGYGTREELIQDAPALSSWTSFDEGLAAGWIRYLAPLPSAPLIAANDFRLLEPYYEQGVLQHHTVSFGEGVHPAELQLSWGEVIGAMDGEPDAATSKHTTLNIAWDGGRRSVEVIIPHSDDALGSGISRFTFADGTVLSMADMVDMALPALTFDPHAAFVFVAGGGESTITSDIKLLAFDLDPAALQVTREGTDLILSPGGATTDSIRLQDWYGQQASYSKLKVQFADGSVWLANALTERGLIVDGSAGSQTLVGLPGYANTLIAGPNDVLIGGGSGQDTYVFNVGSGVVHVQDGSGAGTIQFGVGITAEQVSLGVGSLLLRVGDNGDEIHVDGFDPQNALGSSGIATFKFSDGETYSLAQLVDRGFDIRDDVSDGRLTGTNLVDRIVSVAGADTLVGGAGDDRLVAGTGINVFEFLAGDGRDVIDESAKLGAAPGTDVVRFGAGIAAGDLLFNKLDGKLLILARGSNNTLTIENGDAIGRIEFADGTYQRYQGQAADHSVVTTYAADGAILQTAEISFSGDGAATTIVYDVSGQKTGSNEQLLGGGGTTRFAEFDPDGLRIGAWIRFEDGAVQPEAVELPNSWTVHQADGSYSTYVREDGGTILLRRYDPVGRLLLMETVEFLPAGTALNSDALDPLTGEVLESVVFAEAGGGKTLYGKAGANSFVLDLGSGVNVIDDSAALFAQGGDRLVFGAGVKSEDVVFSQMGSDVLVRYSANDYVLIRNFDLFDMWSPLVIEQGAFDDGGLLDVSRSWGWDGAVGYSVAILDQAGNTIGNRWAEDNGSYGAWASTYDSEGNWISTYEMAHNADGSYWESTYRSDGSGQGSSYSMEPDEAYFPGAVYSDFEYRNGDISSGGSWSEYDQAHRLLGTGQWSEVANENGDSVSWSLVVFDGDGHKIARQWDDYVNDSWGEDHYSADGSSSGTVNFADGGYSTYADDGRGIIHRLEFDSQGGLLGESWQQYNAAPVVASVLQNQSTSQGDAFNLQIPVGGFDDPDAGDILSYSVTLADGAALPAWLSFDAASRTLSGRPGNVDVGSLSLKVTVSDRLGLTTSQVFALDIANVNDAPTASLSLQQQEISQGQIFSYRLPEAAFADQDVGDVLSYDVTLADGTALPSWLSFDPASRTLSGTPGNAEVGTLSLKVMVTDRGGLSASQSLTLNIANVNDAPVVQADFAEVSEDDVLAVAGNVLANDSDVDQGAVLSIAGAGTLQGSYGTLLLGDDGSYAYVLNNSLPEVQALAQGEAVTETFQYLASDGEAAVPATLTVTITGRNDGPTAVDDAVAVDEDQPLTVTAQTLLANDTDVDTGDSRNLVGVDGASELGATVTLDNGLVVYEQGGRFNSLRAGEAVVDSYTYTMTDSQGATSTAKVSVTVTGVNDGPQAGSDAGLTGEDVAQTTLSVADLLANDTDADTGDVLTLASVEGTSAQGNAISQDAQGNLVFDIGNRYQSLAAGETVTDSFAYTVADSAGAVSTAMVAMTIVGANDGPIAQADADRVSEDGVLAATGNVLANDSDVDNGALLQVATPGSYTGLYGSLQLNADGSYSYALDNGSAAVQTLAQDTVVNDVFAYSTSDGMAEAASQLTISIAGANDAPTLVAPIADQTTTAGQLYSYQVAAASFTDVDAGDTLSYAATLADGQALPSWLQFDAASRVFTGTAASTDVGQFSINLVATDRWGASAADTFVIDVGAAAGEDDGCHGETDGKDDRHHEGRGGDDRHHGRGGNDHRDRGKESRPTNDGFGDHHQGGDRGCKPVDETCVKGREAGESGGKHGWGGSDKHLPFAGTNAINVIRTSDGFAVKNRYRGEKYNVEQFKIVGGKHSLDGQVHNLVQAMAAFTPPAAGQTTPPDSYAATLSPVIAAHWQ